MHTGKSEELFKFSVQEMLKDLSQNGKQINLKLDSVDRMSLQSIYKILAGVMKKIPKAFACILIVCLVLNGLTGLQDSYG